MKLTWIDRLQTAGKVADNLRYSDRLPPAKEIQHVVNANQISWGRYFWLWPLGVATIIELLWPLLSRKTEQRLDAAWRSHSQSKIEICDGKIDVILSAGSGAEDVVQGWIDRWINRSRSHMLIWTPQIRGINNVIFPPNSTHNSSQELDHLMVTPHAVYIIETKGWADVQENGTRQAKDGTPLRSPIEQSLGKRDRLKSILGGDVPVYIFAALPHLEAKDVPFGLDARFLVSENELGLVLRQNHQRQKRGSELNVNAISATLLEYMDTEDRAKVRHMRWLALNRPNQEACAVLNLDDEINEAKKELGQTIEHSPKTWRLSYLITSMAVAVASWFYVLHLSGWPEKAAAVLGIHSSGGAVQNIDRKPIPSSKRPAKVPAGTQPR
jgi:hypothetical protein